MSYNHKRGQRLKRSFSYRKLFIISSEGYISEPEYFSVLIDLYPVQIQCLKDRTKSAPSYVLKRMETYIKNEELKQTDEAWLVIDKDKWTDQQLKELYDWSKKRKNCGLAVSNPKFEYWLLLHFEKCHNISNSRDCSARLNKYISNYDKSIIKALISSELIRKAINQAKQRDNPPCDDWPRTIGTTVYKLVENILQTVQ